MNTFTTNNFPAYLLGLTRRELEVLLEMTNDFNLTNAEIDQRLNIEAKSVANYRNRIGDKLNIHGFRLLARFAHLHRNEIQQYYHIISSPPSQKSR